MDVIQDVLIYQTHMMRDSNLGPYVPAEFSPPEYIVVVNALFYASLGVMLLAAFIAMLIKSWVREFDRGLRALSIPEQRAKTREFRYLGMEHWKLQEMVALLPLLIIISLLLFAIGLVVFLFHISKPSFDVTTVIFGVGVLYYVITTTISVFVTSSPFHSPLSRTLGNGYQRVHAYFCPGLDEFLSPNMDITPVTAMGRLRRHIQISLQKSRPYLEKDFEKLITAATVDDVQLSTTSSALRRIHDSMPNSQHSELIQESVWRVAGSPALRRLPSFNLPSWILDRGNDEEYFSRLRPVSVVALKAVFVRMRLPRYKERIIAFADVPRAVSDSQGPWAQLVHTIFDLLPDNLFPDNLSPDNLFPDYHHAFLYHSPLHDVLCDRDTIHDDITLMSPSFRDTLRDGHLRDSLRNGLRDGFRDGFHDPNPDLRDADLRDVIVRDVVLRNAVLRDAVLRDAALDYAVPPDDTRDAVLRFVDMTCQGRIMYLEPEEPDNLINILRTNWLHEEEPIWLLNTLSGLHCDGLALMKHHVSKICLAILSHQAPKWNRITPPSIMLIEAVVTLTAISCSSNETYQVETLTNSYEYPWLLLSLRSPELISRVIEDIGDSSRKELISVLFLVLYALILRGSKTLATQYLTTITAKGDFVFCASALTAIAPALGDDGFSAIGELLLASQTRFLTPNVGGSMSSSGLFHNYDLHLGARQFPDPKIFAILLLLSKNLSQTVERGLWRLDIELRNPWLRLTARVLAEIQISDESDIAITSFYDHRVHNMFAALSLLRYPEGTTGHHPRRESLLLASFLESRELAISSLALRHYMKTVVSYSNLPPPSCYLSGAVQAVFSPILPDHYLLKGWKILGIFVDEFEKFSVEWRQPFAEAFFTQSRRPLLRGNREKSTPARELKEILTWEYFSAKEQEPEFTEPEFGGLDWMAMAWSLHLSQPSGTTLAVSAQMKTRPLGYSNYQGDEEFVLWALFRLLHAAPYYCIIPIIPKLREFVEWFDDPKLSKYKGMISVRIQETVQECKKLQKFHCLWYL